MAKSSKIIIESKFPAVKRAGWETVQEARQVWMNVGALAAQSKAAGAAASRGYALQVGIDKETIGFQSARIVAVTHTRKWGDDPWILRFFEYGTVHIRAMPFMRPAARKANAVFVAYMGRALEGNIKRKTFSRKTVRR